MKKKPFITTSRVFKQTPRQKPVSLGTRYCTRLRNRQAWPATRRRSIWRPSWLTDSGKRLQAVRHGVPLSGSWSSPCLMVPIPGSWKKLTPFPSTASDSVSSTSSSGRKQDALLFASRTASGRRRRRLEQNPAVAFLFVTVHRRGRDQLDGLDDPELTRRLGLVHREVAVDARAGRVNAPRSPVVLVEPALLSLLLKGGLDTRLLLWCVCGDDDDGAGDDDGAVP